MTQIFVKVVGDRTHLLDLNNIKYVEDLKKEINKRTKIPIKYQYLTYNAKILKNNDELKFSHGETLFCNISSHFF